MGPSQNFQSQVIMSADYPSERLDPENSLLLWDDKLKGFFDDDPELKEFIESFPNELSMTAGEEIKDFKNFPKLFDKVVNAWPDPISRNQTLVAMGGGSLGDFAGFVASILKRGVGLVHMPTTWLAAMDSSHGGKTGLNFKGVKNQIGTFYPAQKVIIVKRLLENAPSEIKQQAFGELVKMSLVGESKFFKDILMEKRKAEDFQWRFLSNCIEDKYQFILQDPMETKGTRQVLNFGHTFGHALEAHFGWAHGDAVMQGCFFALEWSRHWEILSTPQYEEIIQGIANSFDRVPANQLKWYKPIKSKVIRELLAADKKTDNKGRVLYIFLKTIGQTVPEKVSIDEIVEEAKRQNWVK